MFHCTLPFARPLLDAPASSCGDSIPPPILLANRSQQPHTGSTHRTVDQWKYSRFTDPLQGRKGLWKSAHAYLSATVSPLSRTSSSASSRRERASRHVSMAAAPVHGSSTVWSCRDRRTRSPPVVGEAWSGGGSASVRVPVLRVVQQASNLAQTQPPGPISSRTGKHRKPLMPAQVHRLVFDFLPQFGRGETAAHFCLPPHATDLQRDRSNANVASTCWYFAPLFHAEPAMRACSPYIVRTCQGKEDDPNCKCHCSYTQSPCRSGC